MKANRIYSVITCSLLLTGAARGEDGNTQEVRKEYLKSRLDGNDTPAPHSKGVYSNLALKPGDVQTGSYLPSLAAIVNQAPSDEKSNPKLLEQINLIPTTDPQTNKRVFKISRIQKGSLFERAGLKVGDLVSQ